MGARSAQEPPGRVGKASAHYPVALLHCAYCGRPRKTAVCRYCSDLPELERALLGRVRVTPA